ncbi:hypothetical protein M9Y10_027487 [Tritrichomonas musculus]|uniref:Uncharacterized protein n=1 Tax=Tritrichomonas musculus TaxID=1915356 RepID=A0ABR2H4Y7_9EUKA
MQNRFLTKHKNYLNDIIHKYLPDFKIDDEIDENKSKKNRRSDIKTPDTQILKALSDNIGIAPNCREYSKETKLLCYSLYSISSGCYRVLRTEIPFPSEQILRKTFSEDVKRFQNM